MAITEVIMPKMGESIMEATVLNWLKQPGDYVEVDEFILEVATDKIDTEVPSPVAGYLQKILVPVGSVATIGSAICVIDAVESLDIKPVIGTVGIDPDELAELALQENATAVLISTHNGMALSYAQNLLAELAKRDISPQVIIGGRLNQEIEGQDMPVDVTEQLKALGIDVCLDLKELANLIRN